MGSYEKKVRDYNSVVSTLMQVIPSLTTQQKVDASQGLQALEASLVTAPIKWYDAGIALNGTPNTGDTIIWIDSQVTSGGSAVFYVTSDRTVNGTPLCSQISVNSVDVVAIDSAGVYARGTASITANKTITVPITKETFTGVQVLGVDVLGSRTMPSVPNGVTVKIFAMGVAA